MLQDTPTNAGSEVVDDVLGIHLAPPSPTETIVLLSAAASTLPVAPPSG